ncbi:chaperone modulator CbpM [Segetibacter koreensis]|uniref:chaperone modulator CbpM n=1 Tax=Segetibacter koreensis TaxID=398037 RepID=UPI0003664DFE|nr:chaperone modulator CbpM [Segetibacter koreensis]
MQTNDLILAEEFCSHYNVGLSFINSLKQFGLIEVTSVEETYYIPQAELKKLEQLARLHYDLDINLEGIDAITHLLGRIKDLQSEITSLKNRLSLYEKV